MRRAGIFLGQIRRAANFFEFRQIRFKTALIPNVIAERYRVRSRRDKIARNRRVNPGTRRRVFGVDDDKIRLRSRTDFREFFKNKFSAGRADNIA